MRAPSRLFLRAIHSPRRPLCVLLAVIRAFVLPALRCVLSSQVASSCAGGISAFVCAVASVSVCLFRVQDDEEQWVKISVENCVI